MGFIGSYGCLGSFSLRTIFQAIDKDGLSEAFNAIDNAIRIDKNYTRAYATKAELYFYEREFDSMMINAKALSWLLVTLIMSVTLLM